MARRPSFIRRVVFRVGGLPLRFALRPPFETPRKLLILQPGTLSEVLLATPLLRVLRDAFPKARIDWAVSDWALPGIQGNPAVTRLLSTGKSSPQFADRPAWRELVQRLREEAYDTCFIPNRSGWLGVLAWQARIRQRIGLDVDGAGFAHTIRVRPVDEDDLNEAAVYLTLARAIGLTGDADEVFYPSDRDRSKMTEWLVEAVNWLGDRPLAILHPGGGANPDDPFPDLRWPVERFALLGNHLAREHGAHVLVIGAPADAELTAAVCGLMSAPARDLAGELTLSELGALGEVASLYVGNDTGPSHVAAAVGCPTLILYGPTDVRRSRPYVRSGRVIAMPALVHAAAVDGQFSWAGNLTVDEVIVAADQLLSAAVVGRGGAE